MMEGHNIIFEQYKNHHVYRKSPQSHRNVVTDSKYILLKFFLSPNKLLQLCVHVCVLVCICVILVKIQSATQRYVYKILVACFSFIAMFTTHITDFPSSLTPHWGLIIRVPVFYDWWGHASVFVFVFIGSFVCVCTRSWDGVVLITRQGYFPLDLRGNICICDYHPMILDGGLFPASSALGCANTRNRLQCKSVDLDEHDAMCKATRRDSCSCVLPMAFIEEYLLKPRLLWGWERAMAGLRWGSAALFRWLCSEGGEKAEGGAGERRREEGGTGRRGTLVYGKSAH